MLSNKTRDKIKRHFEKHIEDKIYHENYEKDFTQEEQIEDFAISLTTKKYDQFSKIDNYRYIGDELLDLNNINLKGDISIIMYNINDLLFKPFLMFLLEKKDGKIKIPIISIENDIKVQDLKEKVKEMFDDISYEMDYQGFFNNNGEIFVFYRLNVSYEPILFSSDERYFFTTVHEIINLKEVYQTPVDEHAVDFFINNDNFCYLEDEDFNLIETPMVGYTGDYYKRIAIIAALGPMRGSSFASMGPYFYFSSIKRALRYACITTDGKPKEVNGIKITLGDTGIYDKGGVVKFVMFMGNEKVFLNRDNDPQDTSEISRSIAEKSEIVKATIKNRDNDSKWVENYDSTIITYKEIDFKGNKRELEPQFTIKESEQLLPISYYYLDTKPLLDNQLEKNGKVEYDYMKSQII